MAKLESSFKNMLFSLFGVTLIASAALGLVNDATKDAIKAADIAKQTNAIAAVLPEFDHLNDPITIMPETGRDSITIFTAVNSENEVVGKAVQSYTYNGFSGFVEIMVGFDAEGIISGYRVLKHTETPGLGSKMGDWFNNTEKDGQCIINKDPATTNFTVSKDGGDIDAITAATISSRAFLDAINRACHAVKTQNINEETLTSSIN